MKPIFGRSHSLGLRLILAILAALALIASDIQKNNKTLIEARNIMETAVSGLYYLGSAPKDLLDGVSHQFVDPRKLEIENKALKAQLQEKNADLLLLDHLKVENQRLRLLLNSPLRQDEYKKIAQVLAAEINNYHQQIVVNRGKEEGAYVGQPVIDEKGVAGQIIATGLHSSRVLLITDASHSIPVQVLRNDVRMIASGTGRSDELILDNVPRSADIKKGDLLVTSGLSGRFLEGYPVAVVDSISRDSQNYFATITAKPLASISSLRNVLLLWPTNKEIREAKTISPQDVRESVKQRLAIQEKEKEHFIKTRVPDENNDDNSEQEMSSESNDPSDIESNEGKGE